VVSNTYYQPNPELVAKADVFRTSPEAATITGRWVATAKEQIKDGSVDVMHTEWIDLKRASEKFANQEQSAADPARANPGGQQGASHSANSNWAANGRVR
jgi:hypothetical protein